MKPYETVTVCGSEYHFKLTTANAVKLEAELKADILSGLDRLAEIGVLAKYYYYAAVSLNDNINKIDDVYSLFDDYITEGGSYEQLQELTFDIMLVSGVISEKTYNAAKKIKEEQKKALLKLLN
jgi:hypothetical protein